MKISLITVCYNSDSTIATTLESIAEQNYSELEYIVVDGGSTDATLDIVEQASNFITLCISEPDQGIYDAMNKGVQRATGEVIGILNSDDFYVHGEVLDEVAAHFAADPDLEVVLGDVDFVQSRDLKHPVRHYRTGNFEPWMFRFGLMPPHPAVFVRKSAYDHVGLYKTDYRIAADFDFLTRLLLINSARYKIVDRTWVRMRTGGVSTSGIKSHLAATKEMLRSLKENKVRSNVMFLLARLPIKYIKQVLFR